MLKSREQGWIGTSMHGCYHGWIDWCMHACNMKRDKRMESDRYVHAWMLLSWMDRLVHAMHASGERARKREDKWIAI